MTYLWIKALHIVSVIAWMAGMLYLPRLYVYHAGVGSGSKESEMLKVMERRLLRLIINPAMIATLVFGVWLIALQWPEIMKDGWLHAKIALLVSMFAIHGLFARWRKQFERDQNRRSAKFYRVMNEVPTLLMILIVILAVVKPF